MKFIKVAGKQNITMSNKKGNMNAFMYANSKTSRKKGK